MLLEENAHPFGFQLLPAVQAEVQAAASTDENSVFEKWKYTTCDRMYPGAIHDGILLVEAAQHRHLVLVVPTLVLVSCAAADTLLLCSPGNRAEARRVPEHRTSDKEG